MAGRCSLLADATAGRSNEPWTFRTKPSDKPTRPHGLDYDAVIIGAGISGMYQLLPPARTRHAGAGVRGRHRRRRHLVLEPLSRRALRFRKLFLRLLVLAGTAATNGTGPSISPASRKPCATSTTSPTSSTCAATSSFRSRVTAAHYQEPTRSWDVTLEDGSRYHHALPDHRHRPALGADVAAHRRRRDLRRPVLPHRALAARARRFRRQARRRHRHRRHRRADDPDHRGPGRPPDRVPAHAQLVRAAAQRQDRRRDAEADQGQLPRDVPPLPGDLRLLPAHARPARHVRGHRGRTRGLLREALCRSRLRHLAGQFPRHPDRPPSQRA